MIGKTTFLLCFLSTFAYSQAVDNVSAFRDIPAERYWRYHYDNDFFAATDQYYSQGVNLEVVHPAIRRFPLTKLLLHHSGSIMQYGMAMIHDVYTPSSIRHPEIIIGDRPFAANWMLQTSAIALDTIKRVRLSSSFSIGIVGTGAGGADMQTSIHRWLDNIEPLGWKNQIRSDVAINYQVQYERLLFSYKRYFSLNGNAALRLGTLNDRLGIGITMMGGYFEPPFGRAASVKNFRFYVYGQPQITVIGYDATLQGGMFNRSSPYTIASSSMERLTVQCNYGAVFRIRKLYLEYSRAFLSREFKTGTSHQWGGVGIGCMF